MNSNCALSWAPSQKHTSGNTRAETIRRLIKNQSFKREFRQICKGFLQVCFHWNYIKMLVFGAVLKAETWRWLWRRKKIYNCFRIQWLIDSIFGSEWKKNQHKLDHWEIKCSYQLCERLKEWQILHCWLIFIVKQRKNKRKTQVNSR